MTQTRVFVSYVPAGHLSRRSAARGQVLVRSPRIAALAGALLASGSAHSIAGADGFAARLDAPVKLPSMASAKAAEPAPTETLPFLTLAVVDATPPAAPAASRPAPALEPAAVTPPPPKPVAAPRRDLAGFLAEQGHQLVPVSEDLAAAAAPLDIQTVALEADALAPPTALATPVVASASSQEHGPQPLVAQSFPMLSVDGTELGAVTMRGDTVHLAALLGLLELRMPAEEFARLKAAPAAESFVSLAALRAAGVDVTMDSAGERLTLAAL